MRGISSLVVLLFLAACGTAERAGPGGRPPCNREVPPSGCFQVIPLEDQEEAAAMFGAQGKADLEAAAGFLRSDTDAKVTIEGHSYSTGNEDGDRRRSQSAAEYARDFFLGKGLGQARLQIRAYGAEMPMLPGAGDPRNLRVELFYPGK